MLGEERPAGDEEVSFEVILESDHSVDLLEGEVSELSVIGIGESSFNECEVVLHPWFLLLLPVCEPENIVDIRAPLSDAGDQVLLLRKECASSQFTCCHLVCLVLWFSQRSILLSRSLFVYFFQII